MRTKKPLLASLALLCLSSISAAGHYALKPTNTAFPKNPYGGATHWDGMLTGYGPRPQGYGGYQNATNVQCTGTITTVYVWVRSKIQNPANPSQMIDDPFDNPPEEVISEEWCRAEAWGWSSSGDMSADADNGLGFEPVETSRPDTIGSRSEGTLFTKRAGGETITLTCDPTATSYSDEDDSEASVQYRSAIHIPRVALNGTTRFYSPDAAKFLTGQQITGTITGGISTTTYDWAINGEDDIKPFKNYTYTVGSTTSSSTKTMHVAADWKAASLSFYSTDKGTVDLTCALKFTLPAGAKFAGGLPDFEAKSIDIESVRPEIVKIDGVSSGAVYLNLSQNLLGYGGDPNTGTQHGQEWKDVEFKLPSPFTQVGQGCFIQLISADRNAYRYVTGNYYPRFRYLRTGALDMNVPYPYQSGPWSLSAKGVFVDSPLQNVVLSPNDGGGNNFYKSTASDSFSTWAMYKPPVVNSQGTVWIPMAMYQWRWQGAAEIVGGFWQLTDPGTGSGVTLAPAENFTHPIWSTLSPSPFTFAGVSL